jgi:SH3-like domain-containing protein
LNSNLSPIVKSSDFTKIYLALVIAVAALAGLAGCNRHHHVLEVAYVSAPQASLRDQVAAVFNRTGTVKNGERVEVLDREKRFVRVRTAAGLEGWVEQRYLVDQKTYDGLQKLNQDHKPDVAQAPGVLRNDTNLHITPGRESDHLYRLTTGAKVSILRRGTAEKAAVAGPKLAGRTISKSGEKAASGPPLEDWWLVRDEQGRVGWVLSRMVDVDVPLEIAQYAEGQRFVAFFVLDEVTDHEVPNHPNRDVKSKDALGRDRSGVSQLADTKPVQRSVPQYLCILTEAHDGLPYDYDQVRVFTWNGKRHRYETAYREHGLDGVLPVTVTKEAFDKEGTLPVFTLRVKGDGGQIKERKYKLNTPMVRRVLAPGEEKEVRRQPRRH